MEKNDFKGIFRAILFAIVISFVIPCVFIGFNWLLFEGLKLFFQLKEKIHWLIFWLLFLLIGLSIIYYTRKLATFISTVIVNLFSHICPIWYHKFTVRWVIFICIISLLLIVYGFISVNNESGFWPWVTWLIFCWFNSSLAIDLTGSIKKYNKLRIDDLF